MTPPHAEDDDHRPDAAPPRSAGELRSPGFPAPPGPGAVPPGEGTPWGAVPAGAARPDRSRRRAARVAAACGLLLLVLASGIGIGLASGGAFTGRAVAPSAPPAPSPSAGGGAGIPAAVAGERAVDPCGLLAPDLLTAFGPVEIVPDIQLPASCSAFVGDPLGDYVDVWAVFVGAEIEPPEGVAVPVGRSSLISLEPEERRCERVIVLPDGLKVSVSAEAFGAVPGDLCGLADIAASAAITRLDAGLPAREVLDPPDALTAIDDFCTLLAPQELAVVSGLDTSSRTPLYANWGCRWGRDPDFPFAPEVRVDATRFPELPLPSERIAGRTVHVDGNDDASGMSCSVFVRHRDFTAASGIPRVEYLRVQVYAGSFVAGDVACAAARSLAATVIPRLPTGT